MIAYRSTHGPVTFAFTDRFGGASDVPFDDFNLARHVGDEPAVVERNRATLARRLGLPERSVVYMNQVHGADVAVVDGPWPADEDPPAVDAMVTTRPGLALAVLVADCVPVVLADPGAGVAAVAHAGRPGLAAGVVPAVLEVMRQAGAHDVIAQLGPAVCGRCYEVPDALRAEVASVVPAAWATTRQRTPALDVPAGVRAQLEAGGAVVVPGGWGPEGCPCTLEDVAYFSYRRERVTGRFAGIAWIDGSGIGPAVQG
ncbi:polyphenol oxidase family protein [Phytoactinopolyspora limicola]|uniref:polyphenol oxidase family protein n=1 Tax=Phytoactinopolyspora limicola TaxID=2715536 RepID=UPI001408D314|nr:polyphenol oxidase family protein [Phytoactinopolyspora limicola]